MIRDIRTVIWKERRGLFRHRGSRIRAALTLLVPLVMVAVYFPWQMGRDWVESPFGLVALLVPMILVATVIPDSFAGERERHTLGTLLASRLPDRAILLGKVAVAVGYGWGAIVVVLLVGLLVVNVTHLDEAVLLYTPAIAAANLVLGFILAVLVAAAGVLISLRSSTAQEAQQMLMAILLAPPMVLGVVAMVAREQVGNALAGVGFAEAAGVATAVLFLISAGLLRLAMSRFRRARLILD